MTRAHHPYTTIENQPMREAQIPFRQSGAVLFFTLVALAIMTLAALAMVRSVDTSNLVAGNIALKQGAIQEADRIMNQAFACMDSGGALTTLPDLNTNNATCNYYASLQNDTFKPFGFPEVLEVKAATDYTEDAETKNRSSFVIERMCTTAGPWSETTCIVSPFGKKAEKSNRAELTLTAMQALYRISVKVTGPRNVVTYSQTVVSTGI